MRQSKIDDKLLIQLVTNGNTVSETARKMGINKGTVSRRLKALHVAINQNVTIRVPHKIVRPDIAKYSAELFEQICHSIEVGSSLRSACKQAGISTGTFWVWRNSNRDHIARYSRAQEGQADALFAGMVSDAVGLRDRQEWLDWAAQNGVDPKMVSALIRGVDTGIGRTIDILKRINPAKYGDKLTFEPSESFAQLLLEARDRGRKLMELMPPDEDDVIDVDADLDQPLTKGP